MIVLGFPNLCTDRHLVHEVTSPVSIHGVLPVR